MICKFILFVPDNEVYIDIYKLISEFISLTFQQNNFNTKFDISVDM